MRKEHEPFIRLNNVLIVKEFDINTKGKDYFVGDIHGAFGRLKKALKAIGFDGNKDRLFCCGDLVDRGASHRDMLDIINQDWFHSCVGNHDNMLINVFENYDPMTKEDKKEPHDIVELPIREFNEETKRYEQVGVRKITYEDYYKEAIAHGDREFLKDFSIAEMKVLREYMENLPLMMRVKTKNGDVGVVHAEIPKGKTFQETIDWINSKVWEESPVAREYLFWGDRARYLPYDATMLYMGIFEMCRNQDEVNKFIGDTAKDLNVLFMGHNIMPVEEKDFHGIVEQRKIHYDTGRLKFIDHGAFVSEKIETNAYGLGIYDDNGELVFFLDSEKL